MNDYTPTTNELREWYVKRDRTGRSSRKEYELEFNRWLAQERAQAKAEALKDVADVFDGRDEAGTGNGRAYNSYTVALMLRAHAIEIERASSD